MITREFDGVMKFGLYMNKNVAYEEEDNYGGQLW